ncbi:MAG: hypothetical protein AAF602_02950 [Myxococcota bacterium]
MEELSSGWLITGAVALVAIAIGVALVLAAVALVVWSRGPGERRPAGREGWLEDLTYMKTGPTQWTRPTLGASIVFHDAGSPKQTGFRWSVQLPRYNTLTLEVAERAAPNAVPTGPGVFMTGVPEVDARFVVRSELPAQTMALLTNKRMVKAMLAMPYLQLVLRADELVLHDGEQVSLSKPGGEEEMHMAVATLVTAMLTTLYAQSGTLLPEHR